MKIGTGSNRNHPVSSLKQVRAQRTSIRGFCNGKHP